MEDIIAPVYVELSKPKIEKARQIAEEVLRRVRARNAINPHGRTYDEDSDIFIGMCGEAAYCDLMNHPWIPNLDEIGKADILGFIDVKTSKYHLPKPPINYGNMILRPGTKPHWAYVSATGNPPHFLIQGWIWGRNAMNPDWQCRPDPKRATAWLIKPGVLNRNLSELMRIGKESRCA